jgi:hypothetical protein
MGKLESRLKLYFFTRALSSIGDEMWALVLPIFVAASLGPDSSKMGALTSLGFTGSLLGFLVFPYLAHSLKAHQLAALADLGQVIVLSIFVATNLLQPENFSLLALSALFFVAYLLQAVWFSGSEVLVSSLDIPGSLQNNHRWNYFSSSFGPVFGPALSGIMYATIGINGIALFNIISFSGQVAATSLLGAHEQNSEPYNSKSNKLNGITEIARSKDLLVLTLIPVLIKFFVAGYMPFVVFRLSTAGVSSTAIGGIMAFYGVGLMVGAASFRPAETNLVGRLFAKDLLGMSGAFLGVLLLSLTKSSSIALSATLAMLGVFSARYTVGIRSIRQIITPKRILPSVISGQGFLARAATPLSGIYFGYILSLSFGPQWIVATWIGSIGVLFFSALILTKKLRNSA